MKKADMPVGKKVIPARLLIKMLLILHFFSGMCVCLLMFLLVGCYPEKPDANPPNIVLILADDLGYGDLGCYGQKIIETPNIDRLAAEGMRFTQFYSGSPVCAPARCVLLTGKHSGHAFIRGNHEWSERGEVWDFAKAVEDPGLEGQYPIPDTVLTLAEVLKQKGYRTACVGKWGLGAPLTEGAPERQGFDLFFGYNCQRQAHTYYPKHLWRNDEKVWLDNALVVPGSRLDDKADPDDPESYSRYRLDEYAPALMLRETLNFLDEQQDTGDPFFLYFASPIPHVPLQAPQEFVEKYRKKIGLEEPYLGDQGYFPNRTPRAAYAAMVGYLDYQVGEIRKKIVELGMENNTVIFFTSDNGPTWNGGSDSPYFDSAGPFHEEKGWAKGYLHEGGIRVPLIATCPGMIQAGTESDWMGAFYDFFPTLITLAGTGQIDGSDGINFLPVLLEKDWQVEHQFLYWEFPANGGQQAVRMGRWKGLRDSIFEGSLKIRLYDLENDLQEEHDVAAEYPHIVDSLERIMDVQHQPAAVERFRMEALD